MGDFSEDMLWAVIRAALAGGEKILAVCGEEDFQVELKADQSPLTIADRMSHDVIKSFLTERFPNIPLLSEEGRSIPYQERENWHEYFLIDPLDGTKEFIKRNGEFTVNIALVRGGDPILGVVYVPVTDTLYYAAEGFGAYRLTQASKLADGEALPNGERLPIEETGDSQKHGAIRVVASRSHFNEETAAFVQNLEKTHGRVKTVNAGSAVKLCLVAEGSADIYPRFAATMEWDVAAGAVVAKEAGCRVVRADDRRPMVFNKEDLVNPWFIAARKGLA